MNVFKHGAHRRLLPFGKRKRKAFFKFRNVALRDRITVDPRLVRVALNEFEGGKQHKILFQRDPFRRSTHFFVCLRLMNCRICLCKIGKTVFRPQLRRNDRRDFFRGKRISHAIADRALRQRAVQRINGNKPFEPHVAFQPLKRGIDNRGLPVTILYAPVKQVVARF